MKYVLFLISVILLVGLFSFQSPDDQLFSTKLKITVIDGLGNTTEGVMVKIFDDEENYRKSVNPVDSALTDQKGQVYFKDLKPVSYFIDARKDDMNNDGEGVKTAVLDEGKVNKVNTVIE